MKKIKILAHPTQIATIKLDDLDYNTAQDDTKLTKMQIRKWKRLRREAI